MNSLLHFPNKNGRSCALVIDTISLLPAAIIDATQGSFAASSSKKALANARLRGVAQTMTTKLELGDGLDGADVEEVKRHKEHLESLTIRGPVDQTTFARTLEVLQLNGRRFATASLCSSDGSRKQLLSEMERLVEVRPLLHYIYVALRCVT